jgi:serine/threonine protein kinase
MVGRQVSRFRVLSSIGQGGMGQVYLAEDPSLHRKVALKFLPADLSADDTARQRLVQEARAAASLDHPFICKVYEVGVCARIPGSRLDPAGRFRESDAGTDL